jgi:hypothetical protein
MLLTKSLLLRVLPVLTVVSCAVFTQPSKAEYTLFSGVQPKNQLSYSLDFGKRSITDSYRLVLPGQKMPLGTVQLNILYPENYNGVFDEKQITVSAGGQSMPIAGVKWQKEKRNLQIDLKDRLQTKGDINIVLGNVRNPDTSGLFYLDCQYRSSPNFPIARYAGTWILNIN